MANNTDNNVSYLNKTFSDFKTTLQEYTKTYFPTNYNDFSEATPGNIFIELASYIGDAMSFYVDTQVQENFLLYAKEKENLYALSYILGYRPKMSYASTTSLTVYQLVPSLIVGGNSFPNTAGYGIILPENTIVTSTSTGTKFLTTSKLDFTDTNNTTVTYVNSDFYLLSKEVNVISAEIKTTTLSFSSPQKFTTSTINDTNILQILDVYDSSNNRWYEVPYLAQSTILDKITNPTYSTDGVPYLTKLTNVPRRFVSRFLSDGTLQLEFGAGLSSNKTDSQIIPTPDNIQLGLVPGISNLYNNYNKASVFFTQEYGIAPSNTTLTVRYLVGGGINSNVPTNDLTTIDTSGVTFPGGGGVLNSQVLQSIASTNVSGSTGGRGGDEIEEIRNNALYAYSSQLRAVTKNDYIIRTLSLPSDYGSIAKAYITQDLNHNQLTEQTVAHTSERNPLSLDLYVLAYNSSKQLIQANNTLKQNLATYLNEYRMVTDAINIKDAFYINIGVNFDITVWSGFNNKDVISNCILAVQNYFNIESWNINQPISLSDITSTLLQVKGVKSVVKIEVVNKQDNAGVNYSQYGYDIAGATRNGYIYPSLDPSIFEVRYPNTDIQGRVITN
jgi:hypothetical protein